MREITNEDIYDLQEGESAIIDGMIVTCSKDMNDFVEIEGKKYYATVYDFKKQDNEINN